MSALEFGRPRRRFAPGRGLVFVILAVIILAGGYVAVPRFEWHRPQIKITPDGDTIGLAPLEIEVTEQGAGLKSFSAVLIAGGTEHTLASEQYDQPVLQKKFTLALSSKLTGLKEGPAVLRVSARDRSWWNFFRGLRPGKLRHEQQPRHPEHKERKSPATCRLAKQMTRRSHACEVLRCAQDDRIMVLVLLTQPD